MCSTQITVGLKTRDRHFHRAIWRRNKILFFSFCFCLMWNFWFKFLILPGGLAERQYTEKCRHTVRLKLNILSADQAVDENLQRNRISFKLLVYFSSTVWSFCSLYNFWQINVVWGLLLGRKFTRKEFHPPKCRGLKAFCKTQFPEACFLFAQTSNAAFLNTLHNKTYNFLVRLILWWPEP